MDLSELSEEAQRRFEGKSAAREKALAAGRRCIRASANAIRAIHREDFDRAHELMAEARAAIAAGREAVRDAHPDVYFAGFLQDAQKEYAEARITEAVVTGGELPGPDELDVEIAPYLNGMAEVVGEGRRAILDLLRRGDVEQSERILAALDDIYSVLASVDFPDAITSNLRRSTDQARAILERTRGDLSITLIQQQLHAALERHSQELRRPGEESAPPH